MVDTSLFDGIFAGSSGVAQTLLATLGISAKVRLPGCKDYDPETGEEVDLPAETFDVKASPPEVYAQSEIDGTNILQGDVRNIIGSADLKRDITKVKKERLMRAILEINGEELRIVLPDPIFSGYQISAYNLQLRKE